MSTIETKPGIIFTPRFDQFFRTHERVMWQLGNIDFGTIQKDKITQDDIGGVRAAMLVESHDPVVTQVLLGMTRYDQEMSAFTITWSYEELKHYAALRTYLEATGLVNREELAEELDQTRRGPWGEEESQFSRAKMFTYTMLQEQATGMFYRNFARHVQEPVLQNILRLVAKDEFRHCQFYLGKAQEELEKDPEVLPQVDEALVNFYMPGPTFIAKYPEYSPFMRKAANPGARDFKEVLAKAAELVGWKHLAELAANPVHRQTFKNRWGVDPYPIARATQLVLKLPFF